MTSQSKVSDAQRRQMIAEEAYFRAERRGFDGADPVRDWCEAEAAVDARLRDCGDERLAERIEEIMAAAGTSLAGVRRKLTRLSHEARSEWQRDIDRLVDLREAMRPKLAELREQGEQASLKLREQADRIRVEIADLVQRLGAKEKH